jgi:hypothetical protein
MKPMSKPTDLAQALEEIDRLRELLAEVERSRDSYQHLIIKMLPPAPPELELSDDDFNALAHSETAHEFLMKLFKEKDVA